MNELTQKNTDIEAQIIRFEEDCAILRNGHGEFRWPVTHLPLNPQIGQTIILTIKDTQSEESEKLIALRKILEELIN